MCFTPRSSLFMLARGFITKIATRARFTCYYSKKYQFCYFSHYCHQQQRFILNSQCIAFHHQHQQLLNSYFQCFFIRLLSFQTPYEYYPRACCQLNQIRSASCQDSSQYLSFLSQDSLNLPVAMQKPQSTILQSLILASVVVRRRHHVLSPQCYSVSPHISFSVRKIAT